MPPPLTTVHYPLYELGQVCMRLLIARMGSQAVPTLPTETERQTLRPYIVVRRSCGAGTRNEGRRYVARIESGIRQRSQMTIGENTFMQIHIRCDDTNDVYRGLRNSAVPLMRYQSTPEALERAGEGDAVMLLVDRPDEAIDVDWAQVERAVGRGVRGYIECPTEVSGLEVGPWRTAEWYERCVIAGTGLSAQLQPNQILEAHRIRYLPFAVPSGEPWDGAADILLSRVAGFDRAVFGVTEASHPMLVSRFDGAVTVAATKLSSHVRARFAPAGAWTHVWRGILRRIGVGPDADDITWEPLVGPTYGSGDALPPDVEARAVLRAGGWFAKSRLLVAHEWQAEAQRWSAGETGPPPGDRRSGDGSRGILEGFASRVLSTGEQEIRYKWRYDCNGEAALACAVTGGDRARRVSRNLLRYVYEESGFASGPRADPESASFGLLSWSSDAPNDGVYYGDDNARGILSTAAACSLLGESKWNGRILQAVLANFRTSGSEGFRRHRIEEPDLQRAGWRSYFEEPFRLYAPHYEAYLWAVFLWAFSRTGNRPLLERTRNAISLTMQCYPHGWRWTNGLMQERARMLLPLAWLVRVDDTPEHRGWLERMVRDTLFRQDACGAIREELGPPGRGKYQQPRSNAEYGTAEAPLIQENGDPVADLLYTTNFVYLGLHEAHAALRGTDFEPHLGVALDRMSEFLCRTQVRSIERPELDGAWFRAFDVGRWEYWGSNGDIGWGAWSIESGWTVGWITTVLGLRRLDVCLWDLLAAVHLEDHFERQAARLEIAPA